MSTNAIIAGGGNGIRIRGVPGKAAVYGSRINKGDFIRCVNFPYNLHTIPFIDDPEYSETTAHGPIYMLISDNILIKSWRDDPFNTGYYQDQHGVYIDANLNIRAKWYRVENGVVDWNSGRNVLFPEVEKKPDLFNSDGTCVSGSIQANSDATGVAAADGIYPLSAHGEFGPGDKSSSSKVFFLIGKIIGCALSSNTIYVSTSTYQEDANRGYTVYNYHILFNWEHINDELEMRVQRKIVTTNTRVGSPAQINSSQWLSKAYMDSFVVGNIIKTQRVTLNNGVTYSNSRKPGVSDIGFDNYTYLEHNIYNKNGEHLFKKIGIATRANSNSDSILRKGNEGVAFRQNSKNTTYCLLYSCTDDTYSTEGGAETDSNGYGYGANLRNVLELYRENDAIYTFEYAIDIPTAYSSGTGELISKCFVDLCVLQDSADEDIILTAHQNESVIYLNLISVEYKNGKITTNTLLKSPYTFEVNSDLGSVDQTSGRIILKKIDDSHVLFIKNAIDKNSEAEIKIIGVGGSEISSVTNVICNDTNKEATYNPYLQTNYNGINISAPIEIANTRSTAVGIIGDYSVITIEDIYTGQAIAFGVTMKSISNTVINYGVYDIDLRVQATAQIGHIDGIASQTGNADETIRYVLRQS